MPGWLPCPSSSGTQLSSRTSERSERDTGPTTTQRGFAKPGASASSNNRTLWLWLPAFAGTTAVDDAAVCPLLHRHHVHLDPQLLLAGTYDDAVDWGDVGEIAAHGEHDVVVGDHEIVGGVEADPAEIAAAPYRNPGMRRIRALQPRFARGRDGADIAGDI